MREVSLLQGQLDLEKYSRRQTRAQINELLTEFVYCCMKIPDVTDDSAIKQSFEELLSKVDSMSEYSAEIAAAVDVATQNDCTSLLRDTSEDEEIPSGQITVNTCTAVLCCAPYCCVLRL